MYIHNMYTYIIGLTPYSRVSSLGSTYTIRIRHAQEYSVQFARLQFYQISSQGVKSTIIAWLTACE